MAGLSRVIVPRIPDHACDTTARAGGFPAPEGFAAKAGIPVLPCGKIRNRNEAALVWS
jgi:hypothetical protein